MDTAITLMSRAIQLDAKYAPAYCDRGLCLVINGEFDKGMADLDTAIRLPPGGAARISIAVSPISEREPTTRRSAIQPGHPVLSGLWRGVSRSRLRPHAQRRPGRRHARSERGRPPGAEGPLAYTSRGKAYVEMGLWDRAAADYSRVIQLSPKDPNGWCTARTPGR